MSHGGIKQLEVQIMGQPYTLACPPDGEAALREAVTKVDLAMCRIRDAGKVKARDRIAVLASLNIAYEMLQMGPDFANSSFGSQETPETPEIPEAIEASLQGLVARLDQALASDGQLL
jgi:cell division protein ZapA